MTSTTKTTKTTKINMMFIKKCATEEEARTYVIDWNIRSGQAHFIILGDHDDPRPYWVADSKDATRLEKAGYEAAATQVL